MRVDVLKLKGKIKECGMTQEKVAATLNMDKSTFCRKMKRKGLSFSVGEMHKLAEILRLTPKEAKNIFLSRDSHYCENPEADDSLRK